MNLRTVLELVCEFRVVAVNSNSENMLLQVAPWCRGYHYCTASFNRA